MEICGAGAFALSSGSLRSSQRGARGRSGYGEGMATASPLARPWPPGLFPAVIGGDACWRALVLLGNPMASSLCMAAAGSTGLLLVDALRRGRVGSSSGRAHSVTARFSRGLAVFVAFAALAHLIA
jgi:hypothetical protein